MQEGSTDSGSSGDGSTMDDGFAPPGRGTLVGVPTIPKSPNGDIGSTTQGPPPRVRAPNKDKTTELPSLEKPRPPAKYDTRPLVLPRENQPGLIRNDDGTEPVAAPIPMEILKATTPLSVLPEAATSTRSTLRQPTLPEPILSESTPQDPVDATAPVNLSTAEVEQLVEGATEPLPKPASKPRSRPEPKRSPRPVADTEVQKTIPESVLAAREAPPPAAPPPDAPPPDAARVARPLTEAQKARRRLAAAPTAQLPAALASLQEPTMDMTQQLPRLVPKKSIDQRPWLMAAAVVGAALFGVLMYFVVE